MLYEPLSDWWCCLNPRERNLLIAVNFSYLTNPTYIERTTFDLMVLVAGLSSSIKMLEWFMLHYGLEYQDIPCGEDCVIHAVVFVGDFWAQLALFSVTDDFICVKPCTQLTFPL